MTKWMSSLTALVLAIFAAYGAFWYIGWIESNFSLVLFAAVVLTGLYWIAEKLYFLPQRRKAAAVTENQTPLSKECILRQPWWLDWTAGLFPVILIVFLFRSFLFEPFKIPSGSMIPTLWIGDLILVNKFHYGVRLPVVNIKISDNHTPQRGDVIVFRYPPKPSMDYIKRVIGLPGDQVAYLNKRLTINGQLVNKVGLPDFFDEDALTYSKQFEEILGDQRNRLLNNDERPAFVVGTDDFAFKQNCSYSSQGVVCRVPVGHYFVMGDNRDNSLDSRYWGFVPEKNIVGKAFFVWMNFGHLKRIGRFN